MPINEIIQALMKMEKMNAPTFAAFIGVTPQAIYDILSCRTQNLSPRIRAKILNRMPEISPAWLVAGEGPMLKTPDIRQSIDGSHVAGDIHQTTTLGAADKFLDEIRKQRELTEKSLGLTERSMQQTEKSLEQNDRLITLLEKFQKGENS